MGVAEVTLESELYAVFASFSAEIAVGKVILHTVLQELVDEKDIAYWYAWADNLNHLIIHA